MSQVLLQPAGDADAQRNLERTIWHPILLEEWSHLIPADVRSELEIWSPAEGVGAWGITPSKNGSNEKVWERLRRGDVVLFGGNGRAVASATVVGKCQLPVMAKHLWGEKDDGRTWEYMYFLTDVVHRDIPKAVVNRHLGYKPGDPWMGVRLVDDERSEAAIESLDLIEPDFPAEVSENEFSQAVKGLLSGEQSTDATRSVNARREQSFLRSQLFQAGRAVCGVCGKEFEPEFLIAAHIKKRADCSAEERLDFKNIVMPACTFGCDHLFERGYIVVSPVGEVGAGKSISDPNVQSYVQSVVGKNCAYHHSGTEQYFEAHRRSHVG